MRHKPNDKQHTLVMGRASRLKAKLELAFPAFVLKLGTFNYRQKERGWGIGCRIGFYIGGSPNYGMRSAISANSLYIAATSAFYLDVNLDMHCRE